VSLPGATEVRDGTYGVVLALFQAEMKAWHREPRPPTRVGRFVRRTFLADLPFVLNVLRGEMRMPYPWRRDES
jgi:lipopolysaccharide/colanic/teichoic acid biosynthesis glycosyltransferase